MTKVGQTLIDFERGDFLGYATSINENGTIIAVGSPFAEKTLWGSGKVMMYQLQNKKWVPIGKPLYGAAAGEHFGSFVDLSKEGHIVAISSPNYSKNNIRLGKVSVFERQRDQWIQLGQDFIGKRPYDRLGAQISLSNDGRTLAIGIPANPNIKNDTGSIEVFTLNTNKEWMLSGKPIVGETYISPRAHLSTIASSIQHIGEVLDLSGDGKTLIAGSNKVTLTDGSVMRRNDVMHENSIVVFRLSDNTWQKLDDIIVPEEEYEVGFGSWVCTNTDGSIIAFCSDAQEFKYIEGDENLFSGYIKVFRLNNTNKWEQWGNKIQGERGDAFGARFSLNGKGDRIAVTGSGYDPDDGPGTMNYAYLFQYENGFWGSLGKKIVMDRAFEPYDMSISLSSQGQTFIVGNSPMDKSGLTFGTVTVYEPKE